jgi:diadenosine tetraphosphatase ApaH/serine/threonine PP2A family protein phosphatase
LRFAALADIHGNDAALEAVLADILDRGIHDIVNLGDSLSGPLDAGRTADMLMAYDFPSVCGNHDRYLIDRPRAEMHEWETDALDQLDDRHLDWLRSLPFSRIWRDDVFMCHATPTDDNRYWLEAVSPDGIVHLRPDAEIAAIAGDIKQTLMLCGHSHLPRAVRLADGRLIVNPGSVGCPAYDDVAPAYHKVEAGLPAASYAIIEKVAAGWDVTFRLVPYDHAAMAALATVRNRPDWAAALATGRL